MEWAVYPSGKELSRPEEITAFRHALDARAYLLVQPGGYPQHEMGALSGIVRALEQSIDNRLINQYGAAAPGKENNMNLNNLEDLRKGLTGLKFDRSLADRMEENMRKGLSGFTLSEQFIGERGVIDQTLHFRKSSQSDFYYFGKYDVTLTRAKPLEEGQKYMVITPNEKGKNMVKPFQSPAEAIAFFRGQKGTGELAMGKDAGSRTTLATMEGGRVNYVNRAFEVTFRSEPVTQTFYVDRGMGFTSEQAGNLVQGRAVYRPDLIKQSGEPFRAWVLLDRDKPKDHNNNFRFKQYHDPAYGFNLEKVLEKYPIKGLDDPRQRENLIAALKEGNRVPVTMVKDGKENRLMVEAVPRYGNINLYRENGKPEKREEYDLTAKHDRSLTRPQSRERELTLERGMRL